MAKSQISPLQERKRHLSMESDNLRYHLSWQCAELAQPAAILLSGVQIATRVAPLFASRNKASKSDGATSKFSFASRFLLALLRR